VALVGKGLDLHIPKDYTYIAMAFSVVVELLDLRLRARRVRPLTLRRPLGEQPVADDAAP
jgi:predicted tellurium resistance membrane protein TerC